MKDIGKREKILALAVVGIMVIAGLALLTPGGGKGDSELPFVLKDGNVKTTPDGGIMVKVDPGDMNQSMASLCYVPVASGARDPTLYRPLFINTGSEVTPAISKYGISREVDVGAGEGDHVQRSQEIAAENWETITTAVVAADYGSALLAAPLASYLGAPIIYDGKGTRDFITGQGIDTIIKVGDCRVYGGLHVLALETMEEVWSYYTEVLEGVPCEYIVVANPMDIDFSDERFFIPGLSLSAGILASERHALVITGDFTVDQNWTQSLGYGTAEAGAGERGEDPDVVSDDMEFEMQRNISKQAVLIDNLIDQAADYMLASSMTPKYVGLVGGPASVPMMYLKSPIWYEGVQQDERGEEYVATDTYYGDLDLRLTWCDESLELNYDHIEDDLYTNELSVGRIVSPSVLDNTALVARSLGYWDYEYAGESAPTDWSTRAIIVNSLMCGDSDSFSADHQQLVFAQNSMIADKEHPLEAWKFLVFDEQSAVGKMQENNAIIYDGHGYPDGWYWLWTSTHDNEEDFDRIGSEDVWGLDLHASPVFGACCLSSALDWPLVWATSENRQEMGPEECLSLAFLHAGAICYIGATEESWGAFFGGLADGNNDEWGYGDFDMPTLFWEKIFGQDLDMGTALARAKEDFYSLLWTDNSGRPFARLCILETVLYGDPAAEIYHDGFA